jgi:hypothetical protein
VLIGTSPKRTLLGLAGYGDLLACNDIGREGDSMLSLTLIFSNFH